MSMSELYVDVNDTNTCSCGTSHEEPPTITVRTAGHSVLFIVPPTVARRTRNIGSQNEDYDVFLNCTSTYILALFGTYYTRHTSRWNRTLTSRPQAPQRTSSAEQRGWILPGFGKRASRPGGLQEQSGASPPQPDRAQGRLRCTSTMSGRIWTRLPSSLFPQRCRSGLGTSGRRLGMLANYQTEKAS